MATKLKELEVTSVDFVDVGANPNAWISIFKRDSSGEGKEEPPTEDEPKPEAGTEEVLKCFLTSFAKKLGFSEDQAKAAMDEASQEVQKMFSDSGESTPEPAPTETEPVTKNETKGADVPMVDVSKMTTTERVIYEDLLKRYSTEEPKETHQEVEKGANAQETTETNAETTEGVSKAATPTDDGEDIYKGLHPAVAEELKSLRKRADAEDAKALLEVAKKYEIIGKKPEELAPVLKSLKDAGGTAYDDMISVLDASVAAVKRSGLFDEIGKSLGTYGSGADDAWAKIEKKADEIQEKNPSVGRHEALDMACMQNPSLVHEYESEM